MGNSGAIIFFVAFVALGLSAWGLVNKGRSILCALAGGLVAAFAPLGALHAWGESQSILWTAIYGGAALIGIVSVIRQVMPRKQQRAPAK